MIFSIAMPCNMAVAKTKIPTLQLMVGLHRIEVEVAATPASRHLGLMNRDILPTNHGMLFVFPQTRTYCMWMRNTKIPLSAAFLDEQGVIVNISEMQPDTDDYHCSMTPVHYVIEMRSGWFQENEIGPGVHIQGLDKAPMGH